MKLMRLAIIAACLAGLARLEVRAAPPATTRASDDPIDALPSTHVTLAMDDVSAGAALALLSDDAGIWLVSPYIVDPRLGDQQQKMPPQPNVTLHANQQAFLDALLELCRQLNLEPENLIQQNQLWVLGWRDQVINSKPTPQASRSYAFAPCSRRGPFAIIATRLTQASQLYYPATGSLMSGLQGLSRLELNLLVDPAIQLSGLSMDAVVDEATDDAGRSLVLPGEGLRAPPLPQSEPSFSRVQANLRIPSDSKRIAGIRGHIVATVVVRTAKMQMGHLSQAGNREGSIVGIDCSVAVHFRPQPQKYQIDVIARRGHLDDAHWQRILNLLGSRQNGFRLLDDAGQPFLFSDSSAEFGREEKDRHVTLNFVPNPRFKSMGAADTLVWEIPTEAGEISIPFEFRDLPVQ